MFTYYFKSKTSLISRIEISGREINLDIPKTQQETTHSLKQLYPASKLLPLPEDRGWVVRLAGPGLNNRRQSLIDLFQFFPEEEQNDLLKAFARYEASLDFSSYADKVLIHRDAVPYTDDPSRPSRRYQALLDDLDKALRGIHHENNTVWCGRAIEAIKAIRSHECYQEFITSNPDIKGLFDVIQQRVETRAEQLYRMGIIMVGAAGLIVADYFRTGSNSEYARDIVGIAIGSVVAYCAVNPIKKIGSAVVSLCQFFTQSTPPAAEELKESKKAKMG